MAHKLKFILAALCITFTATVTHAQSEIAIVTHVVDGDTIDVTINGTPATIRYIGIDTPESKKPRTPIQCFALEAAELNAQLVTGQSLTLERDKSNVDRYGRLLRYAYLPDGRMVNEELVKVGAAFAKRYKPDTKYAVQLDAVMKTAQTAGLGLWGNCTVKNLSTLPKAPAPPAAISPTEPTAMPAAPALETLGTFPHAVAALDAYNCPPTHPIKGNESSMIYHRPGQQAYNKTKPEACYAAESDAVADGFRAAKR